MMRTSTGPATLLALAAFAILVVTSGAAHAQGIRPLLLGDLVINVYVNGGGRTDSEAVRIKIANAIALADVTRLENAAVLYVSNTETLFQYVITTGTPPSPSIEAAVASLSATVLASMGVARISRYQTTLPPAPSGDDATTLRTALIVGGAAVSGALVALVIAAVFCKPRAAEAEEKKARVRQAETRARAEAEMQVQQLVRSAAFPRLQERVIDLEKDEQVRKAIDEVEEHTKKNRNIAKVVARDLLDEPFVEPRDRAIDREQADSDKRATAASSESERRRQRAIDLVENAPWWHNAQIQAEITADLAMPRYSGLNANDDDDDGRGADAATRMRRRGDKTQRKSQTAKIPDHLIDYSAVKVIAEGHHWLAHVQLPQMNPTIQTQVMLAKSTLHGLGVFARRFIDRGTLLFPYANPSQINSAKHIYSANEMRFHFGANWDARLHFVARDGYNKKFCVAEAPKERGWGSVINSCRGTGNLLIANCECVFPDDPRAGVIPWIRVTQTIAPLGELLLDYPFPELVRQQRGLSEDEINAEPPQPLMSTYGISALQRAKPILSAPMPNQSYDLTTLPPPPPPPAATAPPTPNPRSLTPDGDGGAGAAVVDVPPEETATASKERRPSFFGPLPPGSDKIDHPSLTDLAMRSHNFPDI